MGRFLQIFLLITFVSVQVHYSDLLLTCVLRAVAASEQLLDPEVSDVELLKQSEVLREEGEEVITPGNIANSSFLLATERSYLEFIDHFNEECNAAVETCKSSDICGEVINFRCRCDVLCVVYGDCCEDFPTACPDVYTEAIASYGNWTLPDIRCLSHSGFLVIASCPSVTDPLSRQCGAATPLNDPEYAPVTDITTGLSYNNKFCALCHGRSQENLSAWRLVASFYGTGTDKHFFGPIGMENLTQVVQIMSEGINYTQNEFYFHWYPKDGNHFHNCIPNAIQRCPESYGESDPMTLACTRSTLDVFDPLSRQVFANRFCLLCNSLRSCRTVPWANYVSVRSQGKFSFLIDSKTDSPKAILMLTNTRPSYLSPWRIAECERENKFINSCEITECKPRYDLIEKNCFESMQNFTFVVWVNLPKHSHQNFSCGQSGGSKSALVASENASHFLETEIVRERNGVLKSSRRQCTTSSSQKHDNDKLILPKERTTGAFVAKNCTDNTSSNDQGNSVNTNRPSGIIRKTWIEATKELLIEKVSETFPFPTVEDIKESFPTSHNWWNVRFNMNFSSRWNFYLGDTASTRAMSAINEGLRKMLSAQDILGYVQICYSIKLRNSNAVCKDADKFELFIKSTKTCKVFDAPKNVKPSLANVAGTTVISLSSVVCCVVWSFCMCLQ